ncbi:MAG: hypothetical protein OEY59_10735 [Deltaproteobacteria bacterium]|nr:hypothetical protein [Deltaproteobacteria bacterium]
MGKIKNVTLVSLMAGLMMAVFACSKTVTMQDVKNDDEPCWVMSAPNCDVTKDEYLYFVGKNATLNAALTRPGRAAFISAENDAKAQYVAYMEEMIQNKSEEALSAAGDAIEGSQVVGAMKNLTKTFAQKTVNGLMRHDQYFISKMENSADMPLWDVWIRMRIKKEEIKEKVDKLESNLQEGAAKGVENAEKLHKAIKKVQDSIAGDNFFKGF